MPLNTMLKIKSCAKILVVVVASRFEKVRLFLDRTYESKQTDSLKNNKRRSEKFSTLN